MISVLWNNIGWFGQAPRIIGLWRDKRTDGAGGFGIWFLFSYVSGR